MQLNSDTPPIAVELRDQEVRQHTVESQIKIGIPFQIRAMREHRRWTQGKLAEKIGTTQNTISRLENPKTGKPTITTLLRIANACDVGLLVRFVPFGFYGDVIDKMDQTHVEVPSYDEELISQVESEKARVAAASAGRFKEPQKTIDEIVSKLIIPNPLLLSLSPQTRSFFRSMGETGAAINSSKVEHLGTAVSGLFAANNTIGGALDIRGLIGHIEKPSDATLPQGKPPGIETEATRDRIGANSNSFGNVVSITSYRSIQKTKGSIALSGEARANG